MKGKTFVKPNQKLMIGLIVLGTGLLGITTFYSLSQVATKPETKTPVIASPTPQKITALGRIEPRTEIISISAPMLLNSDRVKQLLVDEGDSVKTGQIIAILESQERLEDNLQQAQEQVRVAAAKLEQVKAGAKVGEIDANTANVRKIEAQWLGDQANQRTTIQRLTAQLDGDRAAQKATIAKLEAEYRNAKAEFDRYEKLYQEGAISASSFDSKRLNLETSNQQLTEAKVTLERIERTGKQEIEEAKTTLARIESTGQQQIKEARSTLNQVSEVRGVDVRAAEAEVNAALVAVKKAQTELNQAYIRSPISGKVIKVNTRIGEQISDQGIVDLAETDRMEVIAEIYQSDIGLIRKGQTAKITGSAFKGEVRGKVRLIALKVDQQNIFSNQPGENFDRKVISVRIALDREDSQKVAGLTNSQVTVTINE
ncbi:MAG: biotin/lipoyl-binding protein [Microcystis wesenbergii Mw_MB_S_20031200_S109]|uniref:Biotin/lipoyl-binding protein n=1 Tax=Microcystis wesenbergii Mw_MB_S_20031200_S109D TaxID=2486241 RepID=A0A552LT34_9CHRO|nr:MAG: biotin/lipoyl-binding protein [Microcystis wesenbergii Mw_MB_S_20031200_S109]TRV23382.1 MAG: biotin/lipoyl-binding protein [Microcystis wesenbergii Mw_MB_S_20031200_S109D]